MGFENSCSLGICLDFDRTGELEHVGANLAQAKAVLLFRAALVVCGRFGNTTTLSAFFISDSVTPVLVCTTSTGSGSICALLTSVRLASLTRRKS